MLTLKIILRNIRDTNGSSATDYIVFRYQLYGSPEPNSNAEMLALVQLKGRSAAEKMDKGFIPGMLALFHMGQAVITAVVSC